ncbi:NUDIX domain-containing protein [Ideonella alba]|uniref:NUDIX hydrolase n=1 Tax=Ideonella alba TaxID=2824118 RepID=A0A940YFV0_9BURK|nr:NUDIX hydrolase [Ideonella alba]MBQ0933398.1 NUDIX hydrolase [Ideonella alba]
MERWKPSVTVAAIIEREGRYLLVEERTPEGLKLNNPAGHLDPGESIVEAVVREALEETARVFTPTHVVGVYLGRMQRASTGEDITYLRFAIAGTVGEPVPGRVLDEPIERTLWMSLDELRACTPRHRSPMLQCSIDDHAAGRGFALDLLHMHESVKLLHK